MAFAPEDWYEGWRIEVCRASEERKVVAIEGRLGPIVATVMELEEEEAVAVAVAEEGEVRKR